jgi:broad specificity phosphatase PhoE
LTTFTLVRHGQTDWNLEQRLQGHLPNPLNATGIAQAHAVAEKLACFTFDALYCSDLPRARQTGEIIASTLGIPLQLDKRLREISHGRWEGYTFLEAADLFPEDVALWDKDLEEAQVPGAETVTEVGNRLKAAADDFAQRYPQGKVLIVSHGFAIGTFICLANGYRLAQAYDYTPDNTEIVTLEWNKPNETP